MKTFDDILTSEFSQMRDEKEADSVSILEAAGWIKVTETPYFTFWRAGEQPDMQGVRSDIACMMIKHQTTDLRKALQKEFNINLR